MPNKNNVNVDIRDMFDLFNAEQGLKWLAEEMMVFGEDPKTQEIIKDKVHTITYLLIEVD